MQLVNNAILDFFMWLRSERGQDLLEYAMLGGLAAAAMAIVFGLIVGTTGIEPVKKFANGISACIDFDGSTPCTGGI